MNSWATGVCSTLSLKESVISNNVTSTDLGVVQTSDTDVLIGDSVVKGNRASFAALYISSGTIDCTSRVIRSSIELNETGGILIDNGEVADSIIDNNSGTGIFALGAISRISSTTISNNGRSSSFAGGLHGGGSPDSSLYLDQVTFSGNSTDGYGSAFTYVVRGELRINNSTITNNTSRQEHPQLRYTYPSATIGVSGRPGASLSIENTIVAGNYFDGPSGRRLDAQCAHSTHANYPERLISKGYNFIADDTCGLAGPGDQQGTSANPLDPLLAPLTPSGGHTPTHVPMPGSPVLDAGNPNGCADSSGVSLSVDQRSSPRPIDGDGDGVAVCDIGSVELN